MEIKLNHQVSILNEKFNIEVNTYYNYIYLVSVESDNYTQYKLSVDYSPELIDFDYNNEEKQISFLNQSYDYVSSLNKIRILQRLSNIDSSLIELIEELK